MPTTFEEWREWQKAGAPEDIEGWRTQVNLLQNQPNTDMLRNEGAVGALINRTKSDILDVGVDAPASGLRKVATGEAVKTSIERPAYEGVDLEGWFLTGSQKQRRILWQYSACTQARMLKFRGLYQLGHIVPARK